MRKSQLCLALSASLALMQVSMQPALSESAASSIWQKLAGAGVERSSISKAVPIRRAVPNVVRSGEAVLPVGAVAGHAMLFLKGSKSAGGAVSVPAAALTIHPLLPESVEEVASVEKPTLVAMNEVSGSERVGKQLVAQLAPDQIVAQGGEAGATSTPIPPVVTGTVDLEEFKASNVIDLKVSQSRTFKLRNKIVRTSISDPAVAEPVVVAENQLVLLGKAPGGATLVIWDDAGNSVAIDLKVSRDYTALQAMLREIDPRIIVKPITVGGSDRVLLMGDVDHPESVLRAFAASNTFMDDRGMSIVAANSRLLAA
ncbi:MAG: pilus assembly protein N-terminal domain-containing protein, partial [Candidatus Melainabacteria bacterium]|nr:pilus assembly protein N-terminal domain-containing protein [Candidatus Melainabacteria bacterium]